MKVRTLIAAMVLLGSLGAVGAVLAWVKFGGAGQAPQVSEPSEAVQTVTARTVRWRPTADLVGTVIALRSVSVSNEIAGVVDEVRFDSGVEVQEGDVLLTLESSAERADLEAARATARVSDAAIRAAKASIALWESNVERLTKAVEMRAAAPADLDNARAQLDNGRAQLDRANAELDQARARVEQVEVQIRKKTVRAPFRARTGLRNIHPGQYLAEGSTIVSLQGIADEIYLDFAVSQEQLWRVRIGDRVTARSAALGSGEAVIEVAAIDATANPSTRNIRVRGKVDNRDGRLRPGMFIDVSVPIGAEREFVAVPATAVRRASFGDHVFRITQGETPETLRAHQAFIRLGPTVGSDVIVTEGLKAGEEIAAAGSFKLREGALVVRGKAEAPGEKQASTAN
jgi:membrane fusion protein (multidrug efflux system)